jgi:hypothetical protein
MANQEQLDIIKQGGKVWNKWRAALPDEPINLSGAHIRETIFKDANLDESRFKGFFMVPYSMMLTFMVPISALSICPPPISEVLTFVVHNSIMPNSEVPISAMQTFAVPSLMVSTSAMPTSVKPSSLLQSLEIMI